jgi:hypothetical protein
MAATVTRLCRWSFEAILFRELCCLGSESHIYYGALRPYCLPCARYLIMRADNGWDVRKLWERYVAVRKSSLKNVVRYVTGFVTEWDVRLFWSSESGGNGEQQNASLLMNLKNKMFCMLIFAWHLMFFPLLLHIICFCSFFFPRCLICFTFISSWLLNRQAFTVTNVTVKVKVTLEQSTKAQKGCSGIDLLFP